MIAEGYLERIKMPMVCWPQYEKERDFPAKMDGSLLTYLPSQLVDCVGQASCIQRQRAERIQRSDIKVQIYIITGGKNYGQVGNFGDGAI